MKLFESIFKKDYNYYERFFDTESKASTIKRVYTRPEYYVEDPKGDYNYLLDNNIKLRKVIDTIPKSSRIYGALQPDARHIRDNYWDIKESKYNLSPNIWYLDIETTALSKIDLFNTPEEVVLMQIFDTSTDTMYVLGSKDWDAQEKYAKEYTYKVKYANCKNEKRLLSTFFSLIEKLKPLMVLGWNTSGFDYPYLFNRVKKLNMEPNFSPFGESTLEERKLDNGMLLYKLNAPGIYYLDYMDIYKKYTYSPRSSYSLDNISKVELGESKIDHSCYSTFDGMRSGDSYIFPTEEPSDEWDSKMYKLQTLYQETKDPCIKLDIQTHANDLFVHYGIIDTYLVKKLDEKLQLTKVILMVSSKMGITIKDALGTVKPWASYICNCAYLEKKIPPVLNVDRMADTGIKGGFVSEPERGKHRWLVSVDINSAYPNLSMRGFNMSPETFIPKNKLPTRLRELNDTYFNNEDEEERFNMYINKPDIFNEYTKLLKENNYSGAIAGAIFTREYKGIIPTLVEKIYSERKLQKADMLDWKQKAAEFHEAGDEVGYKHANYMKNQANTTQMVSKVLINSLYGGLGNKYFQLFNIEIARAITSNTRFYIRLLNHRINNKLQSMIPTNNPYVKYNDTDSGYICVNPFVERAFKDNPTADVQAKTDFVDNLVKQVIDPVIDDVNLEFSSILNAFDSKVIKTEREAIADVGVFLAKKKYYMRVYDNEGVRYKEPDLKTMGVEIVRSSTPPFAINYLRQSIGTILDSTEIELRKWVTSIKQEFIKVPLRDISKTSSVSNLNYDMDNDSFKGNRKVAIPINSRAALIHNKLASTEKYSHRVAAIKPGDKVKLLYMKLPNPLNQNVFAYIDDVIAEDFREYVDFDTCWNKYFIKALSIMTDPLGWDLTRETESIDDW